MRRDFWMVWLWNTVVNSNLIGNFTCWKELTFTLCLYLTGVLSDMEWLNTTQLKYPDCVCIVESDTCPSPGVTRLYPSWLGTWLTWSPSGHCNMPWDTCYHLVAMAAGWKLLNNHITRLHHEEYWNIHRKFKTPKWHSNRYPVVLILNLLV